MKFFISSEARTDLRTIAEYISQDNPPRAVSFISELNTKILTVADRPLSFPEKIDWGEGIRSALHHDYHTIFRVAQETVQIMRVMHGARNIKNVLKEKA